MNAANNTVPVYTKVSACRDSVIALKNDGTVWTWGRNDMGQIGDGTESQQDFRSTPVQVKGISNAADIAAGEGFRVVLRMDGTVWAWGMWGNALDPGEYSLVPVKIEGFNDVKAVAADSSNISALKKDGTVWTWGQADWELPQSDALLDETGSNAYEAKQVKGISDAVMVAAADRHMLALKKDGSVWTWGVHLKITDTGKGNLLAKDEYIKPVPIPNLKNVSWISAEAEGLIYESAIAA